jgi:antitoxin HicB
MSEILLSVKIEALEEGGYLATSGDLPELLAQGRTVAETLEIAQDVTRKIVESYLERGDSLSDVLKATIPPGVPLGAKIPVSVVV